MSLTNYYDTPATTQVLALNASTALVMIDSCCVAMVPLGDEPHEGKAPGERRMYLAQLMESPPDAELTLSLGELTSWALRRVGERYVECDDCQVGSRMPDYQTVLGAIFDRCWIREALQWLFENRIGMHELARLRLVRTNTPLATGSADLHARSEEHTS